MLFGITANNYVLAKGLYTEDKISILENTDTKTVAKVG